MRSSHKKILKYIGMFLLFIVLITLFEVWGLIGFVIFILFFLGMRFWNMRESFKTGMRGLEVSIWGKPLDKEVWGKGEMANTEVEVTYKGKKIVTNKMMARFFFLAWFIFIILAASNRYTWNFVASFICLILAVSFKTWDVIREVA